MLGIKETQEFLKGLNVVSLFLVQRLRDGVGTDDLAALIAKATADPEFQKVVKDAYEGAGDITKELKDLDASEVVQLVTLQAGFVPQFLEALKKPVQG